MCHRVMMREFIEYLGTVSHFQFPERHPDDTNSGKVIR